MRVKKIKILGLTILFTALAYFGYVKIRRFIAIDSCLDGGGSWNYSFEKCEYSDPLIMKKFGLTKIKIKSHLIIRDKCAVIFNPNNLKISEAKKVDENSFYISADDAMHYIAQSRDFFKSKRIKIVETDSLIIDFKLNNKLIKSFDLRTKDQFWGIILFDGKNIPVEIDMTSTEVEFGKYMK